MSWGPQKLVPCDRACYWSCGSLPLKHLNRRDLASTSSGRPLEHSNGRDLERFYLLSQWEIFDSSSNATIRTH
ncbi:hypothetical protein H4Q26_004420 [Puccinia striiformis f. sp. tritici PST-130]|nr:hypothetical protein H4Q26_004420 [Puccinia striiformis f. sp. tritici PST-130]